VKARDARRLMRQRIGGSRHLHAHALARCAADVCAIGLEAIEAKRSRRNKRRRIETITGAASGERDEPISPQAESLYCTTCASSPLRYFSATSSSGSALIFEAIPAQPNCT
jgi:hypothetical protein